MGEKTKIKEMNLENIEMEQAPDTTPAQFILSLLQIRDQAHVIHWQTSLEAEHRNFGMFYDEFLVLVDALVESILGKYGKDALSFEEAAIGIVSYDGNYESFMEMIDESFTIFYSVFDPQQDSELYNDLDNIKTLKNKLNYLLSQE
jgi:hypothetical protein